MGITFTIKADDGYFISKYVGAITDDELLASYTAFHEGNDWIPGLHELADLSEANMKQVTQEGLRCLASYVKAVYLKHGLLAIKTAAFAPNDLPFGIARVYEAVSSESPVCLQAFRDVNDAKLWVTSNG